jgi:hypothetical protein
MSIENELLALMNSEGLIVPEVAETWAAKNRSSELAQELEWNNREAGRQYRINQIRQILVRLKISVDHGTRRFISLSIDRGNKRGGGYRDFNDIVQSKTLYEVLLADALSELQRMQEQYKRLKELEPVWKAAGKVREKKGKKAGKAA